MDDPFSPRLGRFVLGPELGRGGMGVVHLAWDPLLKRLVALKQLLNADPILALRFVREAQFQAKVQHPGICKVFEVSSEGAQPFIAMQYIQGKTLGESRDLLEVRDKARLMAEVASAIHAAHLMGLVHRDLKPSNILLEAQEAGDWLPYILDFGLARDQSVADLTLSWGFVGTPAFMSPEQARAEEPTPASDIYSLGATFYALFSGNPPYEATTLVGLIHQQAVETIRPLRYIDSGFPRDLDTILTKCLDPEPTRRYASALELEEDLRLWLSGEPIHARPLSLVDHAWRKVRRYPALSFAITLGFLATAGLLGWNIHAGRRARVQVELAQRFALQVREVEQLLRIERMLPLHDIRPAERQVRQQMNEIQATMARLGSVAEGPGQYALARGHLVLREFPAAEKNLAEAWRLGFRSPEVAYAMGTTLLELYLAEVSKLRSSNGIPLQTDLEHLQTQFVPKALPFFRLAQGQVQEDPAFGEAQVAMLKADYRLCIQKCREAIAAKPWMYEAKLLEAKAWITLPLGLAGPKPMPMQWEGALKEGKIALQAALKIGPSDERIYACEMERLADLSVLQADYGHPALNLFEQADALCSQALKIKNDDAVFMLRRLVMRARRGFLMLRMGLDVRPFMRESLHLFLPVEGQLRAAGNLDWLGHLFWILADGQWRRGEDPLPTLAEADRRYTLDGFVRTQPAALRATALAARGGDPLPIFQKTEQILQSGANRKDQPFYSYHGTVHGMVLLTHARWAFSQGLDPTATLEQAQSRLEDNRKLDPRSVYPLFYLAQVHALKALLAESHGGDPEPELRSAKSAAVEALRVNPLHFHAQLTMAQVCLTQARLLEHGENPLPLLREARAALLAGLKLNPTDFRLHRLRALVELQAAHHALNQGISPLKALSQAEAAARQGLAFKGNDSGLWLALARTNRYRAEWAKQQKEVPTPWIEAGLGHLQKALALQPTLWEAVAEQASLEGLRGGDGDEARKKLQSNLRDRRFLALDYPSL